MSEEKTNALNALNAATYEENIQGQIKRIGDAKTVIVHTLNEWKGSSTTATLDQAALDINSIVNRGIHNKTINTPTYSLPEGYYKGGTITVGDIKTVYDILPTYNAKLSERSHTFAISDIKDPNPETGSAWDAMSSVKVTLDTKYQDITPVTVTANEMITGKVAVGKDGTIITGTIAPQTTINKTLDTTHTEIAIPHGFYASDGIVNIVNQNKTISNNFDLDLQGKPIDKSVSADAGKVLQKVTVTAPTKGDFRQDTAPVANSQETEKITSYTVTAQVSKDTYNYDAGIATVTMPQSKATVSGKTVTVSAGYSNHPVSASVATVAHNAPTFTFDSDTGLFTAKHTQSVGYVADGHELTAKKQLTLGKTSVSGKTVNVPAGYYPTDASQSVATGSVSKPALNADAGTVSVTVNTGYVSGNPDTLTLPTATIPAALEFDGKTGRVHGTIGQGYNKVATVVEKTIPLGDSAYATKNVITIPSGYRDAETQVTLEVHKPSQASVQANVTTGALELVKASVTEGYNSALTGGTETTETIDLTSLDKDFIASNIRNGAKVFNLDGTFSAADTIDKNHAAANAEHILSGKSAFLNGTQINGTMANKGNWGDTLTVSKSSTTIPSGYHAGAGKVTVSTTTSSPSFNAAGQVVKATGGFLTQVTIPAVPGSVITTDDVISGKTVYSNGKGTTGTLADIGSVSASTSGLTCGANGLTIKTISKGRTSGGSFTMDNTIYTKLAAI